MKPKHYDQLLSRCQELVDSNDAREIRGSDTADEFPERSLVMRQIKLKAEAAEIEINLTDDGARPPYHWLAEITLRAAEFKHFLLTDEDEIVETYGKNVIPVDDAGAETLLALLTSA